MREIKLSTFILVIVSLIIILGLIICGIIYYHGIQHSIKKGNVYDELSQKLDKEVVTGLHIGESANGVTIRVEDVTYDENFLVIHYKMEAENFYEKINSILPQEVDKQFIEERMYINDMIKVNSKGKSTIIQCVGGYFDLTDEEIQQLDYDSFPMEQRKITMTSEKEINYVSILDISEYSFDDKASIEIQIMSINMSLSGAGASICEGPWKFNLQNVPKAGTESQTYQGELAKATFKVEPEYAFYYDEAGQKVYTDNPLVIVNDPKNNIKIVIDEAKVSNLGTILHVTTNYEPGQGNKNSLFPVYAIDIIDSHGNIVMEKRTTAKTEETNYFAGRIYANEAYFVRVYKYYCSYYQAFSLNYEFNQIETAILRLTNSDLVKE